MKKGNTYFLSASVGNYKQLNMTDLSTFRMDEFLLVESAVNGLNIPKENIRRLGSEGFVSVSEIAKAFKAFMDMLTKDDLFIFYFSGHGHNGELVFSDGRISIKSILQFVDSLSAKSKILIIDCCYSGDYEAEKYKSLFNEGEISEYIGKGIAVLASSAKNQVSRMDLLGDHSLFSGIVAEVFKNPAHIRKGRVSLHDFIEEIRVKIAIWNNNNPTRIQNPVIRTCIGGTLFFEVRPYIPYKSKEIYKEMDNYVIYGVKSLSTKSMKRLCAFVLLNDESQLEAIDDITYEIADLIKYEDVYSDEKSEIAFKGLPSRAVWCYFGLDESDLIKHNHIAYSIWADSDEVKNILFKKSNNSYIQDGIYVFNNSSYKIVKQLQEPEEDKEEYIIKNKKLLETIINQAEKFIYDFNEVANMILSVDDFMQNNKAWISDVKKKYLEISDMSVAPDDIYEWSEEILSLAGWILDMALMLENVRSKGKFEEREIYLINNATRRYHETLENIVTISPQS